MELKPNYFGVVSFKLRTKTLTLIYKKVSHQASKTDKHKHTHIQCKLLNYKPFRKKVCGLLNEYLNMNQHECHAFDPKHVACYYLYITVAALMHSLAILIETPTSQSSNSGIMHKLREVHASFTFEIAEWREKCSQ